MPRFDFQSVGASMGDSLEEFLATEEARRRQRMLDDITMGETKARAEDRRQTIADRDYDRESVRANRIAEHSLEGEEFDDLTTEMLKRQGYGHMIRPTEVAGDVQADGETSDTRDPNRTANLSRGGTVQARARTANEEKARQAREAEREKDERAAQKAKDEAAAKELERKHDIQLANMTNASREGIAAMGANAKKDAAAEKKADKDKAEEARVKSMRGTASRIIMTIDELLAKQTKAGAAPALNSKASKITGALQVPAWVTDYVPFMQGGDAADARTDIRGLQALLDVDLIREMKTQSKTGATGFGALSERELAVLEAAAAKLSTIQSEPELARELQRIRDTVSLGLMDAPMATPASSHSTEGAPRPRYNPATGRLDAPTGASSGPRKRRYNPATGQLE